LQGIIVLVLFICIGFHLVPDVANPREVGARANLLGHEGVVESIAFDRTGETLTAIGWDGTVRFWDLTGPGEIAAQLMTEDQMFCLNYAPDNKTIAMGSRKEIVFHDPSTLGEPKDRWPSAMVRSMRFSADGRSLLTADNAGCIRLWDMARRSVSATFDTHRPGLAQLRFAPDGLICWASIGVDLRARIGKARIGEEPTFHLLPGGDYFALAFSADGRRLFAGSRKGGLVQVWDVAESRPLARYDIGGWITALAASPDGRLLAHGNHDGTVAVFELATQKMLLSRPAHEQSVSALAFTLDSRLLASGGNDAVIKLWDVPDISAEPPRLSLAGNR
jgi:WD40 repeat protein